MSDDVFNKRAGRFLKPEETKSLKDAHRHAKLACGQRDEDVILSEFLGLDNIQKLLELPGCVGLRIAYGNRWEDKDDNLTRTGQGQLKPRVLLTAVDAKGRDISAPAHGRVEGGKDDGNGDEEMVLGDGYTCPRHCPQ